MIHDRTSIMYNPIRLIRKNVVCVHCSIKSINHNNTTPARISPQTSRTNNLPMVNYSSSYQTNRHFVCTLLRRLANLEQAEELVSGTLKENNFQGRKFQNKLYISNRPTGPASVKSFRPEINQIGAGPTGRR